MAPEKVVLDEDVAQLLYRTLKLEGFFPEFTAEHATKVFPRSGLYAYPKNSVVISQEEEGKDLFVIRSGKVAVTRTSGPKTELLATLKDGDVFGEIGLLRDGRRVANVTAEEDCRIFRLVYADMQYILKFNPALGAYLDELANKRVG